MRTDIFDKREYAQVHDFRNRVIEDDGWSPWEGKVAEIKPRSAAAQGLAMGMAAAAKARAKVVTADGRLIVDRYSPCFDKMPHKEAISEDGYPMCMNCNRLLSKW